MNIITGKTKLIGLIGNPIEHSKSPQLHNLISETLKNDIAYVPFRVNKIDLEDAMLGLIAVNALGFNVTVPYKKDVMKYVDEISKDALLMGAINTVKNNEGTLHGYNTDAEGFLRAFKEEMGTGFNGKKVVILGAGGAARAITVKVASELAERISIINRTKANAGDLADLINDNVKNVAKGYGTGDSGLKLVFKESDIIINTTSVGMLPDVESTPLKHVEYLKPAHIVYDIVYNPEKTRMLQDAEKVGCKVANGLKMLFYQGVYAYEIWTCNKISEEQIKKIYPAFLDIIKG